MVIKLENKLFVILNGYYIVYKLKKKHLYILTSMNLKQTKVKHLLCFLLPGITQKTCRVKCFTKEAGSRWTAS